MAAARQKEMNVSITEDATMSRTRLDGGATVVRVDAIVRVPSLEGTDALELGGPTTARPALSLCPDESSVNQNGQALSRGQKQPALILSEQLFTVFNEADDYDHG